MAWRQDDRGSTSAIGLAVAAATFAIAFVAADLMVAKPGGEDHHSIQLDTAAANALDVIIGQSGMSTNGTDWATSPDSILRFGLASNGTEGFLDYHKIKDMRNASMTNTADNAPDYPEVRAALGVTDLDFHLRTYPVLPSMDDPRWQKDPRGRLAYVGHVNSARGYADVETTATTSGNFLNVSMSVTNDGLTTMIFIANIGPGNVASNATLKLDQKHTRLLAPGETQVLTASFAKMDFSPAVTGVNVQLSDPYGNVLLQPTWINATSPAGTSVTWDPLLSAGDTYVQSGFNVKFFADHFTGTGAHLNNGPNAVFVLTGPDGHVWVNTTIALPKNRPYTYTCTNCTVVGNYTATLWDTGFTRKATDWEHVSAARMFMPQSESLTPVSMNELHYLKDLVANFNGISYDVNTAPNGDVFTDASHIFDLDTVLSRYSTLVVGAEVSQNALNAGSTKWAIADWVQAGGNLVVLGTFDSQSNWLEPVYHAAQMNANGGISAPDPTHPILTVPNVLDYRRYLDNARAWSIRTDEPYTSVLTRGLAGTHVDDTLAVANPGSYNDGSVVLASYEAGALTSPQDDREAERFLNNLLSQSYNMLFLDYGPQIPPGVNVGSSERLVAVPHPNVPGAVVEVRIVMYTWNGS